ncbi:MAG: signal peptidase II [Pseudomonadota bacterium]
MRLLSLMAILAFGIDQISKWLVVHVANLKTIGAIDVLPPLLNFRMGWNTGINFGLFGNSPEAVRYVLIALAVVVSVGLFLWAMRDQRRQTTQVGAGLIIGGALANALDRVIYGAVADFLNMSCCGISNPFTFNLADVAIFAGAFLLIVFDDNKSDDPTRIG